MNMNPPVHTTSNVNPASIVIYVHNGFFQPSVSAAHRIFRTFGNTFGNIAIVPTTVAVAVSINVMHSQDTCCRGHSTCGSIIVRVGSQENFKHGFPILSSLSHPWKPEVCQRAAIRAFEAKVKCCRSLRKLQQKSTFRKLCAARGTCMEVGDSTYAPIAILDQNLALDICIHLRIFILCDHCHLTLHAIDQDAQRKTRVHRRPGSVK